MQERGDDAKQLDHFRQGVEQFNAEKFFDAHESWEAIWLHAPEPDKTFLQGITQVSAAFHHCSRGNHAGANSLLRRGLRKLEPFPGDYRGLKLDQLREELRKWLLSFSKKEDDQNQVRPKIEWI